VVFSPLFGPPPPVGGDGQPPPPAVFSLGGGGGELSAPTEQEAERAPAQVWTF